MSEGHISCRRRFRHLTFRYDTLEKACFCKVITDTEESRAEKAGYELVSTLYKVPIRHSITHDRKGRTIFSYEYLHSIGKDSGLFLDVINQSYSTNNDLVEAFSNEMTSHYLSVISQTLDQKGPAERKTALYEERIRRGGRIDHYYDDISSKVLSNGSDTVSVSEFDQFEFVINGGFLQV